MRDPDARRAFVAVAEAVTAAAAACEAEAFELATARLMLASRLLEDLIGHLARQAIVAGGTWRSLATATGLPHQTLHRRFRRR